MRVELERENINTTIFKLPERWNMQPYRIERVFVNNNVIPPAFYYMMGPRTICIKDDVDRSTRIFADI
jgi:uncharacterized 2Fe-2S/4Fe-4S cluster protein (DUF4445 family)